MFQQMGFGVGVALLVDAALIRMVVVLATRPGPRSRAVRRADARSRPDLMAA